MHEKRQAKWILTNSAFLALVSGWTFNCYAQNYPVKPISILIGYAAGGGLDQVARRISPKLSESLGQPVIVQIYAGASGAIANERVAKAPADGYTLLLTSGGSTILPSLRKDMPYDMERDLTPVSLVAIGTGVLIVHPNLPVHNVKELIDLAKANPGKLNFGSSGIGSFTQIAGELFNLMAKSKVVHIPYKGNSEVVVAVASGQIEMTFGAIPSAQGLLNAGKLKALAVTSIDRSSLMSSLPTLHESGLRGFDRVNWYGVLAPAGVPTELVTRLNALLGRISNAPDMKDALNKDGFEVRTTTPAEYGKFLHSELELNAKILKLAGVKAE